MSSTTVSYAIQETLCRELGITLGFFCGVCVTVAHCQFSFLCCVLFCFSLFCVLCPILPVSLDCSFYCPFGFLERLFHTFIFCPLPNFPVNLFSAYVTMWYFGFYPLANEVAKGYSNATVRPSVLPSFRNILVNTLESTSFNGFLPNLVHT